MNGFMIAAPQSRSGKTTITLGLLRALRDRGVVLAPAKAGPDFIDPAYHAAAAGAECINLDAWAMRPALIASLAQEAAGDGLLVVEAAMGLFDGAADGSGSAADLAALLKLPVILIVDCARLSHSVAAIIRGFRDHRTDIAIAGLILNRAGSERHKAMLEAAIEPLGIPLLGVVMRNACLELPERHLGLVQARENGKLGAFVNSAAELIANAIDIDGVVKIANRNHENPQVPPSSRLKPLGIRTAVAHDDAFSFIYPHILEGWRLQNAEITFFSPLADEEPDSSCDAIYLSGGYPELHAGKLANASRCRAALQKAASAGKTIYGECGGYMAMGESLVDAGGVRHAMFELLHLETSFAERHRHLGYRQIKALDGGPFEGRYRGHEFHYSTVLREEDCDRLFAVSDASGTDIGTTGLRRGTVCGSFMHLIDRADR